MLGLFASAFALGVAFSAPPGAVSAEVWRRGLVGGFVPAFLVAAGSLFGDAVWAMVALAGAAFIVETEAGRVTLGIAGAIALLTLALKALAAGRRPTPPRASRAVTGRGHFATGAVISLANPYAVALLGRRGWGGHRDARRQRPQRPGRLLRRLHARRAPVGAVRLGADRLGEARTGVQLARCANLLAAVVLGYFGLRLLWSSV